MNIEWVSGAELRVRIDGSATVVSGNREGLLSLSRQFAALAEEAPGSHIHYDEHSALEDGSSELIVERVGQAAVTRPR